MPAMTMRRGISDERELDRGRTALVARVLAVCQRMRSPYPETIRLPTYEPRAVAVAGLTALLTGRDKDGPK